MGRFNEEIEVQEITIGKIDDGKKYVTSTGRQEIANDASVTMYLSNPAGAAEDSFVLVTYAPSADAEIELSADVSQDGTGSALTVLNAKVGLGSPPQLNARTGDSYTVNGETLAFNLPGGSNAGPGSGGGSGQAGPTTFLLSPDGSILFELFNRSGGNAGMGISASWFEVDL